jgi:hypothetical protein
MVAGPLEEVAEVAPVRLERAAAVASQKRGCRELRLVNLPTWAGRLDRSRYDLDRDHG